MKDYWCFDHKQIEECFQDFQEAKCLKTDPSIFRFYLSKLEKDWQAVFLYEPSYEDLIKSQFLCLLTRNFFIIFFQRFFAILPHMRLNILF